MTPLEDSIEKANKRKIIDRELQAFLARGGQINKIPKMNADELMRAWKDRATFFNRHGEKAAPINVATLIRGKK